MTKKQNILEEVVKRRALKGDGGAAFYYVLKRLEQAGVLVEVVKENADEYEPPETSLKLSRNMSSRELKGTLSHVFKNDPVAKCLPSIVPLLFECLSCWIWNLGEPTEG